MKRGLRRVIDTESFPRYSASVISQWAYCVRFLEFLKTSSLSLIACPHSPQWAKTEVKPDAPLPRVSTS